MVENEMQNTADIIIIGGGISGVALAAELAKYRSVIILEMEDQPGYHATGRSAATWSANCEPALVRDLTLASGKFLKSPPQGFCDVPLMSPRGEMILGLGDEEDKLAMYRGGPLSVISVDQAAKRIPTIRKGDVKCAFASDGLLDIDVDALQQAYVRQFRHHGGRLVCKAEATGIFRRNNVWKINTPKGIYTAPLLVNAAGAWADECAEMAGVPKKGLQPKRRSAALLPAPKDVDVNSWPLTYNVDVTFYIKPISGKLMISPSDATPVEPHDAWADDLSIAEAIDQFQNYIDFDVDRVEHTWGGLRTFTTDNNPVVGFEPDVDGFFWLAGQGGHGIQISPAVSQIATSLILHQRPPADIDNCEVLINGLSPARFDL